MDAELILKVLFGIIGGLATLAGAVWIVIQMIQRSGLVTKRMNREDAVDDAATSSTVTVLRNTQAELQRLYAAVQASEARAAAAETRAAAAETRASQQMGLVLALTRDANEAKAEREQMRHMLGIAKKAQNEMIRDGFLADPLVDIPTNILRDDR